MFTLESIDNMYRALAVMVVEFCCGASFAAQQAPSEPETLIRLNVAPAAAPRPALKYLLLPELKEMNPGNPIEGYLKCIVQQHRFAFNEGRFEGRKSLLAMPLEALPAPEVREIGRFALGQVDRAARLDNPDWQVLLKLRADGIATLLPDVQEMRSLARALQARSRVEIAESRVNDAIGTVKTMLAMTRHMGEHPTLLGDLVAIAIADLAIGSLEELLEQPDCPNFYWALTTLPDPLVSLRIGLDGERLIIATSFRDLDLSAPMSAERIKKFIESMERMFLEGMPNGPSGGIPAYLAACKADEQKLAAARNRLVDSGLVEASVNAFPADQVILLDEALECQVRFDNITKNMGFSARQFESFIEKACAVKQEPAILADAVLPAQTNARRAQGRLEQRIALLRHVEALRMYAAEHHGAFPAKLSDVTVPLPDDPFTGEPFCYEVKGASAHVRGTPPEAEKKTAAYRLHYEITLKK
jgi:hypothetical protein